MIGYTPFYRHHAPLATTASGPLIVTAERAAGPGRCRLGARRHRPAGRRRGAAQRHQHLYRPHPRRRSGPSAALLIVSGPGSIAQLGGCGKRWHVRHFARLGAGRIQSLSGSGQVNLGSQNLTITNASGTFSGTIGRRWRVSCERGSLTLAGGQFTLAGTGSYTGGTIVSGGSFNLTGSLIGDLLVLPAGSFTVASGGSYANPSGVVINLGATTVNGTMTASVFNAGTLGGTGNIVGNVLTSAR